MRYAHVIYNKNNNLGYRIVVITKLLYSQTITKSWLLPRTHSANGGKVIGAGVHIYVYMFVDEKIFESYFSDQLTFSNIRSRTSRRIYKLALPLPAPEMLSSLSKSRISIFNAHLTLFVHRMTSHNSIGRLGTCLGTERRRWQTRQVESLQNWKEVNLGSSA